MNSAADKRRINHYEKPQTAKDVIVDFYHSPYAKVLAMASAEKRTG